MSSKTLVFRDNPAPVGGPEPVTHVAHADLMDALAPLMELLGTSTEEFFQNTLVIGGDQISFLSCTPKAGVEPVKWGPGRCAQVWAWPVTVDVRVA